MSLLDASSFNSVVLDTKATNSSLYYKRDMSVPLNTTMADAGNLGTVTTNKTQLNLTAKVMRENPAHFYKFTLDGDSLKLSFTNNTGSSDLRLQLMDSTGKIVADNSSFASQELQDAYKSASSSSGLDQKAGDYFVKVTFDVTSLRSVPQTYSVQLYSGTKFSTSYQTTARTQTSEKQTALIDDTMTYSLIDALAFENKTAHKAGETAADAVNIGWLYENKSALSVSSQLTEVCSTEYYSFSLQKGDNLKIAFNNHTNTSEIRFQLYDSSGVRIYADSHGTAEQKAAYEALGSSDGLAAKAGQYMAKVSYVAGEKQTKQIYDFKVYSGTSYDALYKTSAGTESAKNALANGRFGTQYSVKNATVSYLMNMYQEGEVNIMDTLSQTV